MFKDNMLNAWYKVTDWVLGTKTIRAGTTISSSYSGINDQDYVLNQTIRAKLEKAPITVEVVRSPVDISTHTSYSGVSAKYYSKVHDASFEGSAETDNGPAVTSLTSCMVTEYQLLSSEDKLALSAQKKREWDCLDGLISVKKTAHNPSDHWEDHHEPIFSK
ncbi:hypothetical protein KY331_01795 [Candidatus Woesearchaeota archaeon]|nr:hypothetical protein [Candidatus Woesearchaeota archaeon]